MQIVIDIPEGLKECISKAVRVNEVYELNDLALMAIENAIAKGIVLPNHGRLIDADAFEKGFENFTSDPFIADILVSFLNELDETPTVLEANKE